MFKTDMQTCPIREGFEGVVVEGELPLFFLVPDFHQIVIHTISKRNFFWIQKKT